MRCNVGKFLCYLVNVVLYVYSDFIVNDIEVIVLMILLKKKNVLFFYIIYKIKGLENF